MNQLERSKRDKEKKGESGYACSESECAEREGVAYPTISIRSTSQTESDPFSKCLVSHAFHQSFTDLAPPRPNGFALCLGRTGAHHTLCVSLPLSSLLPSSFAPNVVHHHHHAGWLAGCLADSGRVPEHSLYTLLSSRRSEKNKPNSPTSHFRSALLSV